MSDPWAQFADAPAASSSAPAADPWAQFADAPTASASPNPAIDAAKQLGNLPVVGAASVLGAPGSMGEISKVGVPWIADKIRGAFGYPPNDQAFKDDYAAHSAPSLPTGNDIVDGVKSLGVPVPDPQTKLGQYVRTADEFAGGALAGPGGIVRKTAADVVLPAILSQAAGDATKGSAVEPYARLIGALTGNVGSAGVRAIENVPTTAVTHALGDTTPAQLAAAQDLQDTAARIGVPLTGPEAVQHVTNGGTTIGNLQRMVEGSQRGGAVTAPFYAQRPGQVTMAGNAALDTIGPASATPSMLGPQAAELASRSIDGVRQDINATTAPLYRQARAQTLDPADFDPIRRDPAFQQSLAALRADPVLGPEYRDLPNNSIGVIDAVTKDMNARSQTLANVSNPGFQPQTSAAYARGAGEARDIARDPARGGVQDYDDALTMQAQARAQNLEPLQQGPLGGIADAKTTQGAYGALLPAQPLAGGEADVGRAVSMLAQQNPALIAALVRQRVADQFDQSTGALIGGPNQAGGAKFAKDMVGTPQKSANLDAALGALPNGGTARNSFGDLFDVLQATGRRKVPGSNTAADTQIGRELSMAPLPVDVLKAVRTGGLSIPGTIADRSHNFWLDRRAGSLGNLFVAPDSATQMGAMAARGSEQPWSAALARQALDLGSMFDPR